MSLPPFESITRRILRALAFAASAILFGCVFGFAAPAAAQIDASGHHARYMVELEPHLVWQWTGDEVSVDDGIGFGFRASIPVLQDGPIPNINNNLAISFGLDWAHFGGGCYGAPDGCDEDDIWVPVTLQWNFFITQTVSLFPELGLGFRDALFNRDVCVNGRCRGSDLEVHPVLWFGARFRVADQVALVLRLGTPSLEFGMSFLM